MSRSTLRQLDDRHHSMACDIARKQLDQINYMINPNDIGWMFLDEIIDKNAGRSKKVFYRLMRLAYEKQTLPV